MDLILYRERNLDRVGSDTCAARAAGTLRVAVHNRQELKEKEVEAQLYGTSLYLVVQGSCLSS